MTGATLQWLTGLLAAAANLVIVLLLAPPAASLSEAAAGIAAGRPLYAAMPMAARALGSAWPELAELARRSPSRPEGGEALRAWTPLAALALSLAVVPLSPGLCPPGFGAAADLPTVLALLVLARCLPLAGLLDGGRADPALRAHAVVVAMARAAPAMLVAIVAMALSAGGLGFDRLLTMFDGRLPAPVPVLLAVAFVLSALSSLLDWPPGTWSGADRAILRLADAVRGAAWIELATALLFPGLVGHAPAGIPGIPGLAVAILLLPVRLLLGAAALGVARQLVTGRGARKVLLGGAWLAALLACAAAASAVLSRAE